MLKTKKLYRLMAGLLAALMICASVPSVAYAGNGVKPIFQFSDENGNVVQTQSSQVIYTVGEVYNINDLPEDVAIPGGYEFNGGDNWTFTFENEDDKIVQVPVKKTEPSESTATVTIKFVDENKETLREDQIVYPAVGEKLYSSEALMEAVNGIEGYIFQNFTWSSPDNPPEGGDSVVVEGSFTLYAHYKALEPVEPDTATVTIKFVDENKETLREDQVVYPTVGEKLYSSEALMKAVNSIEGYIFQNFTWSSPDNMPEEGDTVVAEGSFTLYAHYKALEPAEPDTATVTIKFVDENKETLREDQVVYPVVGEKLYSSEALMEAVNSIEGYIFQNFTWSSPDNMPEEGDSIVTEGSYTLYAHYKALEPVEPETATVTIKFVDENKESLREDQVVYPTVGEKLYSSEVLMNAVNSIEGYIFRNFTWSSPDNAPEEGTSVVEAGNYTLYAHYKALDQIVEDVNIRFEFIDVNGAELRAASNVGTTWAEGDTAPALASLVADEIKAVEANGYKFDYMTLVYDDGTESSSLQEPVVVPDYDGKTIKVYFSKIDTPVDVNFRVEFVDKNGNTLQEAANIATTYSDFGSSQKLSELLADDIARVEAKGYKHFAYTLVYDDGSESSSIVDPVVVPDYNGKTIKAYFAKAEETEDVNIRFEFVDMAGETILPAMNYATIYTDSEIGPKLSGVVSNEITAVEAKGYKFVMFTLVYDDGSESSALADPVVVPDYDGKTIKVYFAEADTYEDVNIRFEFVDMTGSAILPATNYATTYTDSAIGPKVSDVVAEETAKLSKEGYVFDHFAWVYSDGTETELNDPVVVPDYHNTTIKVYYAQPAHYRFTFINDKTGEVIADTLDVKVDDVKTNVDKYVLDLVARERSIIENAGWTYAGIRNAYNDAEYAQNDSLVVPGGPYEYKVCFTRDDTTPEEPENPGTEEPSNPGNGGSNSSNSSNGGSGSDASKSDAPADNSSKILPKTGYGEGTVPVIGITAIALAAVCGAAGYAFIARRRVR